MHDFLWLVDGKDVVEDKLSEDQLVGRGVAGEARQVQLVEQGGGGHPLAPEADQLAGPAGGGAELLVERRAVRQVEHLDHRRLVGPLALADDPAGVAPEGLEEVALHGGVVELDRPRAERVEVGLLAVAAVYEV